VSKLIKKMYVYSEMEAAGVWLPISAGRQDRLDEILLSLAHKDGGCKWEFGIELILLQTEKCAMRLRMFSDAWQALKQAPEIFEVISEFSRPSGEDDRKVWPRLITALQFAGWKKVKPEPREIPNPPVCHACGRP
jgi:hypothetical protein